MSDTINVQLARHAGSDEEFRIQWAQSKNFRDTLKKYLTDLLDSAIIESEKVENLSDSAFTQHNAGVRKTLRTLINTIS